jgi:polyhydroxyalkanoate synthesis regulator phasin
MIERTTIKESMWELSTLRTELFVVQGMAVRAAQTLRQLNARVDDLKERIKKMQNELTAPADRW